MKITPEMETYFLSFALTQDVRSDVPEDPMSYRGMLLEVANKMQRWNNQPHWVKQLRRAYTEIGVVDQLGYYEKLARAYMEWLSEQTRPDTRGRPEPGRPE